MAYRGRFTRSRYAFVRNVVGASIITVLALTASWTSDERLESAIIEGPVAQLAEQRTLNPQVVGSIPTRPTITVAPTTTSTTTSTTTTTTTTTTTLPVVVTTVVSTTVPTTTTLSTDRSLRVTEVIGSVEARPIPFLIDNQYGFYEKGDHIVELQRLLGLRFVDGIYGPDTRKAHMGWFGSPEIAQRHFFDRGTWYTETIDLEEEWRHNWANWDEPPSLGELVDIYFEPEDRAWALKVAECESSAKPTDTYSNAVSHALAVGWFQHLSKFWLQRSEMAGWYGYDIFDTEPNVAVAAWLFYSSGDHHWNPSKSCWGGVGHGKTY